MEEMNSGISPLNLVVFALKRQSVGPSVSNLFASISISPFIYLAILLERLKEGITWGMHLGGKIDDFSDWLFKLLPYG